ncbi:MAG TPA: hypothetical protein ENN09_02235, partial [Planctomycetes bacterium]|nr:hypothetical protein [Planctomycetota bacterium]
MLKKRLAVFMFMAAGAALMAQDEAGMNVQKIVTDAVLSGKALSAYVEMFGQNMRARAVRADADGVVFSVAGTEIPKRWDDFKPYELLRLARSAAQENGETYLLLARYALRHDMKDEAVELARRAGEINPALQETAEKEVVQKVIPPEQPRASALIVRTPAEAAVKPSVPRKYSWEPVGIGGGGGMFSPASSPHDPNLMFVNSDMGHFLRSTDGGRSWRMYNFREITGHTVCRPIFHPQNPNTAYTYCRKGVMTTSDRGETWRKLADIQGNVLELAIDPDAPAFMLAGTDSGVMRSMDGGATWQAASGVTDSVVGLFIDRNSTVDRRSCFAGGSGGVFRSTD